MHSSANVAVCPARSRFHSAMPVRSRASRSTASSRRSASPAESTCPCPGQITSMPPHARSARTPVREPISASRSHPQIPATPGLAPKRRSPVKSTRPIRRQQTVRAVAGRVADLERQAGPDDEPLLPETPLRRLVHDRDGGTVRVCMAALAVSSGEEVQVDPEGHDLAAQHLCLGQTAGRRSRGRRPRTPGRRPPPSPGRRAAGRRACPGSGRRGHGSGPRRAVVAGRRKPRGRARRGGQPVQESPRGR